MYATTRVTETVAERALRLIERAGGTIFGVTVRTRAAGNIRTMNCKVERIIPNKQMVIVRENNLTKTAKKTQYRTILGETMMTVNGHEIKPFANLRYANLEDANLNGAYLEGAYLKRAYLNGANLEDAILEGAILDGANLINANLDYANLENANLEYANLEDANLRGVTGFVIGSEWMKENFEFVIDGVIVYKVFGEMYKIPSYWDVKEGAVIEETVNPLRTNQCGSGINFSTLKWVRDFFNYSKPKTIWRCIIKYEDLVDVVVPYNTDGKARCARLTLLETVKPVDE